MLEPLMRKALGGRYALRKQLGASAFSDTYLAEDLQLPDQPICVVKRLKAPTSQSFDWESARRFFDAEAQALYHLSQHSDRIPRLLAHFEENRQFYLVQDYVEGHDLSHEITPGRSLQETQVIALIQEVLAILAIVHRQGVIHRDVKPQNLIRRTDDGAIVLIDFGAVKQLSSPIIPLDTETAEAMLIGTPGYMPDEQRIGKPRYCSDIYAVGVMAIQALTGLSPREIGEDPQGELCWRQVARVSPKFAAILTKMVRSHWRDRYPSIQVVLADLDKLQQSRLSFGWSAMPLFQGSVLQKTWKWSGLCLLLLGSVWGMQHRMVIQKQIKTNLQSVLTQPVDVPIPDGAIAPLKMIDSQAGSVLALAMYPEGNVVISGGKNKVIQLWDLKSGQLTTTLTGHLQDITALHVTPNGNSLVSASSDGTIKIWNLKSGLLQHTLMGHHGRVNSVHITPDGRWAVSGGSDRQIKLWDIQSGQELRTLTGHKGAINQIELTPDGHLMVSASDDGTIKLWDVATGKLVSTLVGDTQPIRTVTVSPNSQILVSGSETHIKVWNVASGQLLKVFPATAIATQSVIFSRDGRYLISGHGDGSIKLWDWQTASLLAAVKGHSDRVVAMAICPNNRTLVSGSIDQRIGIWRLKF